MMHPRSYIEWSLGVFAAILGVLTEISPTPAAYIIHTECNLALNCAYSGNNSLILVVRCSMGTQQQ
jgi:hypothetical protein